MSCPSSHMFKINDFRLFGPSINAWGIISHRTQIVFFYEAIGYRKTVRVIFSHDLRLLYNDRLQAAIHW